MRIFDMLRGAADSHFEPDTAGSAPAFRRDHHAVAHAEGQMVADLQ